VARLIVIKDTPGRVSVGAPVLMDEEVNPDHLADERSSLQIIERLAWAVNDADLGDSGGAWTSRPRTSSSAESATTTSHARAG
jgi:hypothetical protein